MNKVELRKKYDNEKVYVVEYNNLHYIRDKFTEIKHSDGLWSMFDNNGRYLYRYDVEGHPEVQQIIPYVLVIDNETGDIFATKRIGGESRLLNKISIACGGHIGTEDEGNKKVLKAAKRELEEELWLTPVSNFKVIGFVRDMTSSTSDHTGVVITIRATDIAVKETHNLEGFLVKRKDLPNIYSSLEGWSQYIVDYIIEKNAK